jgi:hypothetical protein
MIFYLMKYNIVFFPGMIFHELSHLLACLIFGVKVRKVKFFGLREAYVIHERPNAWQSAFISLAPFLLGNLMAFYFFSYAFNLLFFYNPFGFLFLWLAFSFAHYSFPSDHDARNIFDSFKRFYLFNLTKRNLLVKILLLASIPFVFFPLSVLLALMLLFNSSYKLRLLWVLFVFFAAFNQDYAFQLIASFVFFVQETLDLLL